jgi:hypothetical protein
VSIVVVHSVTGQFSSSLSATATINGVTAGNALFAVVSHIDQGGNSPTFTISDGTSYTQDIASDQGGQVEIAIARRFNVAGGNYTLTVTASAGTAGQSHGRIQFLEVSGLGNAFDTSGSAKNTGTQARTTSNTATLASSSEFALAVYGAFSNNLGGFNSPPSGGPGSWTNLFNASESVGLWDSDYQIISGSNAAFNVSWGTTGLPTTKWNCAVATYTGAALKTFLYKPKRVYEDHFITS